MIEFFLNGKPVAVDIEADTPLLWALRERLQKTGTKFGCGQGLCGACTVLVNGNPVLFAKQFFSELMLLAGDNGASSVL